MLDKFKEKSYGTKKSKKIGKKIVRNGEKEQNEMPKYL